MDEIIDQTCTICGFEIDVLDIEETSRGPIHADRQCPTGKTPKNKRQPKAPKMGDPVVVKEMRIVGLRGAHAECDHPATASARAKCRRERAKQA